MRRVMLGWVLAAALAGAASAQPKPADPEAMIAANSYPLTYRDGRLGGPGAERLREATADAQFVMLGEDHYDHEIPIFAGALYRMLHDERGFHHLAVEQEALAMAAATAPGVRGDAARIGAVAGRYPTLFEFASDEDLDLLALVGRIERNADPLWGLEQTTSGLRSLEELRALAPSAAVRAQVDGLIAEARRLEPEPIYRPNFLTDSEALAKLTALQAAFAARPESRAALILSGLVKSAEIYSYYTRAEAGEPVGLYNNTEREAWIKASFLRHYRAAERRGETPRVMFKFGDWHMYRGMGPTGAYTIGNFAHEFAIANGMHAVGIQLVAMRPDATWGDVPPEIRGVLPAEPPTRPTLIDLRPLRPVGRVFRQRVEPDSQWLNRALVNGYDFVLVLPDSRRARTTLSGLKLPFGQD